MIALGGTALAAGGGRLLGGLAAPAAKALARKATFRWQVWWKVRKRVDFPCQWRHYRKWLKTLTPEELATPVEEIHGPLAKRLDDSLSAASAQWSASADHSSRALRLVELTYPAIAAASGDADRAQLSESWAQARNVVVREHLSQLVGPSAALSSDDLAKVLQLRSTMRRAVRLQAFDLTEPVLSAYFDQVEILDVPAGQIIVLLGDFGAGKSEIAETWHRSAIEQLAKADNSPLPVWLNGREMQGSTLERAVEQQLGPSWRQGRGASIAVDGLDETDPATAQTVLEAARVLVRTYSNVRILLAARPGILAPTANETSEVKLLAESSALELVELAGGKAHSTWRWTEDMRATVTRPFFALAAGVLLARDEAPKGEADLIRGLVENALSKGTERSAVTSESTRQILERLAVGLTRTGADTLSFGDRQIARSSRLVADRPDGSVLFSLPIFQHWFAAQAILGRSVTYAEVIADLAAFNRWRWAAAVAALSANSVEALDKMLGTWVTGNPGAAAWIVTEAFGRQRDWRTAEHDTLDANTSGARLLFSLRTWADAIGPLAKGILPYPVVHGFIELGVTVSGHRIDIAFSTSVVEQDNVTEVPPGVHPFVPHQVEDWRPWISGAAPEGDAWPWRMVQERISASTLKKLSSDPFLGDVDGVWAQERRFDLSRRLLDVGSLFYGNISASEVKAQAQRAFELIERNEDNFISFPASPNYSGAELNELITWVDNTQSTHIASHLPERDEESPSGGWVWSLYSPGRLMEFEVEVYGRACEAYDEALRNSFRGLAWSMSNSALAPFGVVIELSHDGSGPAGNWPSLTAFKVPMPLIEEVVSGKSEIMWSMSGRAVIYRSEDDSEDGWDRHSGNIEKIRSWLALKGLEPITGLGWSTSIADDMSNVRPASSVAASWLWNDLQNLGLGSGTFPQLK